MSFSITTNREDVRKVYKPRGATTRDAAIRVSEANAHQPWLEPAFQADVIGRVRQAAGALGRVFTTGPEGFSILAS